MIDAIDGSFVANPPEVFYLLLDNFDEHFLDEPTEYGIIGYQILGNIHKVWFKNFQTLMEFFTRHHFHA
jgi:hypothetical protein